MPDRKRPASSKASSRDAARRKGTKAPGTPRKRGDAADTTARASGSDITPSGSPTKESAGYGTSQGASGATSGGADPGGSVNIPHP